MDHARRIAGAAASLDDVGVEALLVSDLENVRYLTGFTGTNAQALVTRSGATLFTDARYEARAATLVRDAEVVIYPQRLNEVLVPELSKAGVTRLGFEAESMTVASWKRLEGSIGGREGVPTSNLVEALRRTKDAEELALIRAAVRLGDATFGRALDGIVPGSSTEREVAAYIEHDMRKEGADGVSFPPIVASGPLSSHVHHTASDRVIEKGDLVVLDLGCKVDGYCSDLTRTVVVGPAGAEQLELHETVLRAQKAALGSMAPGVSGRGVDATAREIIEGADVPGDFKHGLGHGVGLDVHEAPRLHRASDDVLAPGDVVTVEPGVYDTESEGLRIEDCVVVTEGGVEILTTAPKDDLIEL